MTRAIASLPIIPARFPSNASVSLQVMPVPPYQRIATEEAFSTPELLDRYRAMLRDEAAASWIFHPGAPPAGVVAGSPFTVTSP